MGSAPICNCFNPRVNNIEELKTEDEVPYLTTKDQASMDNENIVKKVLHKTKTVSGNFEEVLVKAHTKSIDQEEFTDFNKEIPKVKSKPRPQRRPKIPYEVVPNEECKKYSVGEILSRAIFTNIDFRILIQGVKYSISDFYYLYDESVYRGEFDEKFQPHGRGFLFFPDDSVYIGYFSEGQPNGQGKYLNFDKVLTEGNFISLQEGVSTHNGVSLVVHGEGAESWPDHTKYFGNFHMGVKQGMGKLSYGGCEYEGEFYNGLFNGKGKLNYENGDVFEGEWQNGLKHGAGELRQKNGKVYKGFYENDEKCGEGVMVWPDRRRYKGQWRNGKMHGIGIYTFYDKNKGRLRTSQSEWREGERIRWISPNSREG